MEPKVEKDLSFFKKYYGPNKQAEEEIKGLLEKNADKRTLFKKISSLRKEPISQNIIDLFYDQPSQFFAEYKTLLENTSFFDLTNTSIFMHYFDILYQKFKPIKNSKDNKNINFEIYENNFDNFFKDESKNLQIQDYNLDTPLIKLVKKDKIFFLQICEKLKKLDVLNEELLTICNINEESCFNIIVKEIEEKKNIIFKSEYYDLYNNFINYFPSLVKSLPKIKRNNIKMFSLKLYIDVEQLKENNFNEIYNKLFNLVNNDLTLDNFEYLYYPLTSGVNYFNILFQICQSNEDYSKLILLIEKLLNKKTNEKNENKNDKELLELCIISHIENVLRSMSSKNKKGENENEYGIKLMNEILSIIIKDKSETDIKKILSTEFNNNKKKKKMHNYGIYDNIIFNPNLSFNDKMNIIKAFNDKTNGKTENLIDKDFLCLYKLFDLCDASEINESNILNIYKDNKYIKKIIEDFYFIGKLYKQIYIIFDKYDKNNINNYILKLNEYLSSNYKEIFSNYKINYGLSDEQIKKLLDLIILYENQNLNNNLQKEYINSTKDGHYLNLYKKFILTDNKLILFNLKYLLMELIYDANDNIKFNKDKFTYFVELFLSFNYDFDNFINIYKDCLITYMQINKTIKVQIYTKFLSKAWELIKDKPFELSFYNFSLDLSYSLQDINILSNTINFYSKLNILIRRYLNSLILNWEEECKFHELSNLISTNILPFCPLLINNKDSLEDNIAIVNFFFDEFIYAINPSLKNENNNFYKKLFLDFNSTYEGENNKDYTDNHNHIYLAMMLIYIRIKIGKYNPQVLVMFISYFKNNSYREILISFIKCYLKSEDKINIPYNFFMTDCNLFNKDEPEYLLYKIDINKIYDKNNKKEKNPINNRIMQNSCTIYLHKFYSLFLRKLKYVDFSLVYDELENMINDQFIKKYNEKHIQYNNENINNKGDIKEDESKGEDMKNNYNNYYDSYYNYYNYYCNYYYNYYNYYYNQYNNNYNKYYNYYYNKNY